MYKIAPVTLIPHRYRQLDSLRGLAALFVFCGHFLGLTANRTPFNMLLASPLGILFNGNAAVMFFFILSGFVLSLPFIDGHKPLRLIPFYVKRIFRIYPAFIFSIVFSLILKYYCFDKTGMAPFSGWAQSFWVWDWNHQTLLETLRTLLLAGPNFNTKLINPVVWSLVIEMKMCIVLPFLIVIVSRNSAVLNIGLLFILAWLTYQYNSWELSVFYLGILMAKYKGQLTTAINKMPVILLTSFIAAAVFLYNNNFEFLTQYEQTQWPLKIVVGNYLNAIGSFMALVTVLSSKRIARFFERRAFTFLGDISYGFYLVHLPLLLVMSSIFSTRFAFSGGYIFLSALLLAVIIAWLVFVLIEQPFQRLAVKLVGKYPILNNVSV